MACQTDHESATSPAIARYRIPPLGRDEGWNARRSGLKLWRTIDPSPSKRRTYREMPKMTSHPRVFSVFCPASRFKPARESCCLSPRCDGRVNLRVQRRAKLRFPYPGQRR